jgi:hypothetical protein
LSPPERHPNKVVYLRKQFERKKMKKTLAIMLALCVGIGSVGCSRSTTTIQRAGYTFEVISAWRIEEYDEKNLMIYPTNGAATILHVHESDFHTKPRVTLEEQYDDILNFWFDDDAMGTEKINVVHSKIMQGSLGGFAYCTADRETTMDEHIRYSSLLCFFSSPEVIVVMEFYSSDKIEFDEYSDDIVLLYKSVALTL